MIAIPNMDKPKSCFQCSFNDGIFCALIDNDTDAFIKNNPTEQSTKVLDDCPLIEIDDDWFKKMTDAYVLQQIRYGEGRNDE